MYLTVKQISDRLGISPALVYLLVEQGELACIRLGQKGRRGTIRVSEAQLSAFLEARGTKREPPAIKPAARKKTVRPVLQNLTLKLP